jgi:hypothetical protein
MSDKMTGNKLQKNKTGFENINRAASNGSLNPNQKERDLGNNQFGSAIF